MKILVIGGTGFIGSYVLRDLLAQGHEIAVFHRGQTNNRVPASLAQIVGNRNDLGALRAEFERLAPDVVLDFILADERQAQALMETFRGLASRVVAISSQDVYRAYEVLLGKTAGPVQEMPITEESDLRTQLHPYGPEQLRAARQSFSWFTEDYDKIPVERTVLSDGKLPGTVLRLPMVYGPGDPLHRFFPVLKRMDDRRPAILIEAEAAGFIPPRGYVEDVAAAIVLATISDRATGRIYNVAARQHFSELEWARKIGDALGWSGSILPIPLDKTPPHLRLPLNFAQNWMVSSARIRTELGFDEAVSLGEGIRRTIEWERANPPVIDAKLFDYAAEDAALRQLSAAGA